MRTKVLKRAHIRQTHTHTHTHTRTHTYTSELLHKSRQVPPLSARRTHTHTPTHPSELLHEACEVPSLFAREFDLLQLTISLEE
jgi:hypothetical protein